MTVRLRKTGIQRLQKAHRDLILYLLTFITVPCLLHRGNIFSQIFERTSLDVAYRDVATVELLSPQI